MFALLTLRSFNSPFFYLLKGFNISTSHRKYPKLESCRPRSLVRNLWYMTECIVDYSFGYIQMYKTEVYFIIFT